MKLVKSRLALLALAASLASTANAAVVSLSFSGTFSTSGDIVFGQSGDAIPYDFRITYDTARNTNTQFYGTGAQLGDHTTTHEWHGYSASGIVATNLRFGNVTWDSSNIQPMVAGTGASADLWFDTDLSQATPTQAWMMFATTGNDSRPYLTIGGAWASMTNIQMSNMTHTYDVSNFTGMAFTNGGTISAVPEPSTYLMMGMGLLALFGYQRRRANRA